MAKVAVRSVALAAAAVILTGCGDDQRLAAMLKALSQDQASVCASVSIAFPPFADTVKACRTNSTTQTATMDAAGNPSVVQIPSK